MQSHIWDHYGRWDTIATEHDTDGIKRFITGDGIAWKRNYVSPELAYVFGSVRDIVGPEATALDFGCGLGRNGGLLKSYFPRVVGYDIPEMVASLKKQGETPYSAVYDDIGRLTASEKVSLVYDSVVFQHIVDPVYIKNIVDRLVSVGSIRNFVTIKNSGIVDTDCHLLNILQGMEWSVLHREKETLSFDGHAHDVIVLKR